MTTPPSVFLGVDAGGSHTEAVVIGESGAILARVRGEPGAVTSENLEKASKAIARTARAALKRAGTKAPVQAMVAGAAGAGRERLRAGLERALKALKLAKNTRVTGDGEIALAGAFPAGAGIVLISGTGSVAYGRDADGKIRRAGGLGWQLGDEGSGYALGRMALAVAGRALDGRGIKTTVCESLLAATESTDLDGLIAWAQTADRAAVAALSPTVIEAADHGDSVARQLVDTAATDLALLAAGLLRQFNPGPPDHIALAGSLLAPGSPVRRSLTAALGRVASHLRILDTPVDAALGAARLARGP